MDLRYRTVGIAPFEFWSVHQADTKINRKSQARLLLFILASITPKSFENVKKRKECFDIGFSKDEWMDFYSVIMVNVTKELSGMSKLDTSFPRSQKQILDRPALENEK